MGPFFLLQKRHFIHKLSVKKQETGQKTGKNPPKKVFFISPSDQLAEFGLKSWQLLAPRRQKFPTFEDKLGQLVRGADKNTFFWRFFCPFLSCFLPFQGQFVYEMPFLQQKKWSHLTFSSRRSASYKVPLHIGGHHFLLCQQTNTKYIAGQSAMNSVHQIW